MKKLTLFSALILMLAFLLTACDNGPPTSTQASSTPQQSSSQSAPPDSGTLQLATESPYNANTVFTDNYIFYSTPGGIYRVRKQTGEFELFISEETHDMLIGRSERCIAAVGNTLYFLSPNHFLDRNDPATLDDFELRIMRANVEDATVEQVAVVEHAVYYLFGFGDYLVAHNANHMPGITDIPEMESDEGFKVFLADAKAPALDKALFSELDSATKEYIENYIFQWKPLDELEERIYGGPIETGFISILADDAYYYMEFGSNRIFRAPLNEGDPVEIELSDEVTQALQGGDTPRLLNYDADWLYFHFGYGISRISKDGSEYQELVTHNLNYNGRFDVAGGMVFYEGRDGGFYMNTTAIVPPDPEDEMRTFDATVLELTNQLYVQPDYEDDLALLGERVQVNPGAGAEVADSEGNRIAIGDLEAGAKVTITFAGFIMGDDGTTTLKTVYRIELAG